MTSGAGQPVKRASNRFGWDYRTLALSAPWSVPHALGAPPVPIIDAHIHVAGETACRVFDEVRRAFGVERVYTMTGIAGCEVVRQALGDAVRFTAFPSFHEPDRGRAFRAGFLDVIEQFRTRFGSRMLKLWASPRLRDLIPEHANAPYGSTDLFEIDSPWRVKACELGDQLGMMYMIHIADPDAYYKTKYANKVVYGEKLNEYAALERMLDRFTNPWIAAHMGGWPEHLGFLDQLLTRHPNLYLDTSATKWVVRELGFQPTERVRAFFLKWSGRLLFGSDIVVQEDHMRPQKQGVSPMADLADSPEAAFDLYASRYWALRTMFETGFDGESPISDPDLKLVDADRYEATSAPRLGGLSLPVEHLRVLYRGAADALLGEWWGRA